MPALHTPLLESLVNEKFADPVQGKVNVSSGHYRRYTRDI